MRMSVTTGLTPHELLAWDTEFWGRRVGRASHLDGLTEWAAENTVGMVGLLLDAADVEGIHRAEENGYRMMDIRVTLARQPSPAAPWGATPRTARAAHSADTDRLVEIARTSHRITRFYADPLLDNARCDDLYESWIRQSCGGWAHRVFVVDNHEDTPIGYVTVHLDGDTASIGLIAVDRNYRGKGSGSVLVRTADWYAHAAGATEITVVTQGRNVAAQRVFQACGFRTTKTEVWLHAHYGDGA